MLPHLHSHIPPHTSHIPSHLTHPTSHSHLTSHTHPTSHITLTYHTHVPPSHIPPSHIPLTQLLKGVTISQGGVLPHIPEVLLFRKHQLRKSASHKAKPKPVAAPPSPKAPPPPKSPAKKSAPKTPTKSAAKVRVWSGWGLLDLRCK